jgi:hypothetical protein
MIDFVISLPTWAGLALSMITTSVVGLVVYLIFYKLILQFKRKDLKEPTSNIFRVVGLLVSLMLALAFSEVIIELRTIRTAIQRETVAISDIFGVLKMLDAEETREIRSLVIDYAQAVIDDDWPALANDRLGRRAGPLKTQIAEGVLNLNPANQNQEKMLSHIIADIDALSDYRVVRLDSALAKPPVFIYVIIFGFMVTMACFGVYEPQAPLVMLVSLYTLFVGLVLFLIIQLSDPFQGGIGVSPTAFEYLVETLQSEIR